MKFKQRVLVSALALAMVPAPAVMADGHDIQALKNQVQMLLQRIEQLEQKQQQTDVVVKQQQKPNKQVVTSGNDKVRLSISGQVNRGVLITDDGDSSDVFHVDNDASSTRFRLIGEADVSDTFTVGAAVEVEIKSDSTADVSQVSTSGTGGTLNERRLEFYLADDNWGKVWVGQGWTASEDTSEYDLSGTALAGYSATADMAGGMLFRSSGGALSDTTVGDVFTNLDGLGRRDRLRYDTPTFNGLTLSASVMEGDAWDVAVTYAGEYSYAQVVAALAYSDPNDLGSHDSRVNGSVSALFNNGFNVTLAAGQDDGSGAGDPQFYYGKLGYKTQLNSAGSTAFSIDYHHTDEIGSTLDEGSSYGIQAVQVIDAWSTELYMGFRTYELERAGADFQNIDAFILGGRVKF